MKNSLFILAILLYGATGFSQETEVKYDEALAKSLNADEYGMKKYVFCLLKSGTNTTASKEETKKLFEGHMANIGKLAKEGKLVVAGPFMKNDRNYRRSKSACSYRSRNKSQFTRSRINALVLYRCFAGDCKNT